MHVVLGLLFILLHIELFQTLIPNIIIVLFLSIIIPDLLDFSEIIFEVFEEKSIEIIIILEDVVFVVAFSSAFVFFDFGGVDQLFELVFVIVSEIVHFLLKGVIIGLAVFVFMRILLLQLLILFVTLLQFVGEVLFDELIKYFFFDFDFLQVDFSQKIGTPFDQIESIYSLVIYLRQS